MKKAITLLFAAMMSISMTAQTAVDNIQIQLADGEKFDTHEKIDTQIYKDQEEKIINNYTQQIKSSALFRAMGGEEISQYVDDGIKHLIKFLKYDEFNTGFWWWKIGDKTVHKLVQNKSFRDFLANRMCEGIKTLCEMYPAIFHQTTLLLLNEADKTIAEVNKHTYHIVKTPHKSSNGSVWYEQSLQRDGHTITEERLTDEDIKIAFGMEGWFVRRMLVDKISMSELKAYLKSAREAVESVDKSHSPMYQACYNINNDVKLYSIFEQNFCLFNNGKHMDDVRSITCMRDATGSYYQVYGEMKWMKDGDEWSRQIPKILYDRSGNIVYQEIIKPKN